jgi:hypothetical protein
MSWKICAFAAALGITVIGCGSAPVPAENVTQAKSSISAAEAVGAQSVPKSALHLKMAKDQVTQAEAMIQDGETEEAKLVLLRAQADAELALALAREASIRAEAQAALKKVQELKSQ